MAKQYLDSGLRKYGGQDLFDWQDLLQDNKIVDRFMAVILAKIVPAGTILPFGGQPNTSNDPPGFLYLTPGGREVSRTTYAELFAVIGTTYGSGNGTTTFKLPDLAGRVPLGYDANLGEIGGNALHSHDLSKGYGRLYYSGSRISLATKGGVPEWTTNVSISGERTNDAYTATTGLTLSGDTSDNSAGLPPYISLAYIIKI